MTKVAVAIVHAPGSARRRAFLTDLKRSLLPREGITRSSVPDPVVVEDVAGSGLWPTVRKAWRTLLLTGKDATHGLVLHEDMLAAPDLLEVLPTLADLRPEDSVSLFTGRSSLVERAERAGSAWVRTQDAWWGGSWMMPLAQAYHFVRWCDRYVDPAFPHDDGRAPMWAKENGQWLSVAVPSPLEHAGARDSHHGNPSGAKGRTAARWLGTESCLSVDWTRGADAPPEAGGFSVGTVTAREHAAVRQRLEIDRQRAEEALRETAKGACWNGDPASTGLPKSAK